MYYDRNDQYNPTHMNTTDRSKTVDNLAMNTDYIFQSRAYTKKGYGPWSNKLPFRTFGQFVLEAPRNLRLDVSESNIRLFWDTPSTPSPNFITHYEVQFLAFV
ncbi:hypothetical protein HELRODRAFT_174162 [Helobdella robusta]|uniref:Fibronectin type-III domain-containing protein n=1 Tax=Helobdella robusta TaxID=6412 RepID=T1F7P9_HELRO|nr:hypothetical protein HELRODRAFT_174162 [Helobdella robusta]ESO02757.1 hypothetical protein HELRODRAFT_174162 [Helobdella robusta]